MKKLILMITMVFMLLSLTACSGFGRPEIVVSNSNEVTQIMNSFEGVMTPQEILDEIYDIDLTGKKVNYAGMESEKVTNEEDSTSITYFSKDGKKVYALYEGYGEECIDFYTESKSGYDLVVKYIYPGTEYAYADITFEKDNVEYGVSYELLNKDSYYGAESIYVTAIKDNETFDEFVSYVLTFSEGEYSCIFDMARYIDENGDYRDFAYGAYDRLLVGKYDDTQKLCDVPVGELSGTQILMGPHTVYLGENDELYIETTLVRVFGEGEDVAGFVKSTGFTQDRDVNDEFDIAYNDVVLKFAKDCKVEGYDTVFNLVTDEYNDYVYKAVSFNKNGEISSVSSGSLSYY